MAFRCPAEEDVSHRLYIPSLGLSGVKDADKLLATSKTTQEKNFPFQRNLLENKPRPESLEKQRCRDAGCAETRAGSGRVLHGAEPVQPEQGQHWGPHATAVLTTLAAAQASAAGAARGGAPHLTSRVLESQDSRGRNVAGACDRGQLTIRHPANTPPTPAVRCKAPETVTAAGVQPRPEPSLPIETGASGRKGLLRGRGGAT